MKRIKITLNLLLSLLLTCNAFGQWNTNGDNIFYFGKVGIGTTTPQQPLDITGYLDQRLRIHAINNTNNPPHYAAGIELSGELYVPNINIPTLSSWKLTNVNGKFGIHNSGEPAFTITYGRDVGIGTFSPQYKLDVHGVIRSSSSVIKHTATNKGWRLSTTNGGSDLLFRTDPPEGAPQTRVYLKQNGNVGIGTSDPAVKLHIQGADNDGTTATLKVTSGSQNLLIDGNEIDGDNGIYLNHNLNKNVMMATGGGNVGIGTNAPTSKLHVVAPNYARVTMTATTPANDVKMFIDARGTSGDERGQFGTLSDHDIRLYTNSQPRMIIKKNGNIGIGTVSPHNDYKLSVNGKIRAKEIVVETGWADFVFEDNYKLMSLQEVEAYIHAHKHLPDVPSAKVIEEKGVSVGEMEAKLLQKIEELTLHMIALKKENDALKNRVFHLEEQKEN